MRAPALLHRLPHAPEADRTPRVSRRRGRKRAAVECAIVPALSGEPEPPEEPLGALALARHAGGPLDRASYTCACGFVFAASVSTTVACPHCGASQAW